MPGKLPSKSTPKESDVQTVVEETTSEVTIKLIKVQSLVEAHLIYNGRETGQRYEWSKAGVIVEVNELDVPELLAKRLGGQTCCGSKGGNVIFEAVGE